MRSQLASIIKRIALVLLTVSFIVAPGWFWIRSTLSRGCCAIAEATTGETSDSYDVVDDIDGALPESTFRLNQTIHVGVGTFQGDREAFLRHEEGKMPSLNPDIHVDGRLQLRTWFRPDMHIRLQTSFSGEGRTTFGVGWRGWDAEYGQHSFNFADAGLPYTKSGAGVRIGYGDLEDGAGVGVLLVRTDATSGEVVIEGDDSFGPFFLGRRRIVPGSERVVVDGRRLRRGDGPGDGDYSIDEEGGFIYFHTLLLAHETARVKYDYYFDDPALASRFVGAAAAGVWGDASVRVFALRDDDPVEERPIVERSGSTMVAYGAKVEWAGPSGVRTTNTVVATDYREQVAATRPSTQLLTLRGERTVYRLSRRPVLYESEEIVWRHPGRADVDLVRHLDYTLDYADGELHLAFEPMDGGTLLVRYRHVDGGEPKVSGTVRGVQSLHRIEYADGRWRTAAWLNVTGDGFLNAASRTPPAETMDAGAEVWHGLGGGWALLGDVAWTRRRIGVHRLRPARGLQNGPAGDRYDGTDGDLYRGSDGDVYRGSDGDLYRGSDGDAYRDSDGDVYRGSVGVEYRRDRLETRLRLGRHGGNGALGSESFEDDYVEGELRWRGSADVKLEFHQPLDGYGGGLPERLAGSVATMWGGIPVSVSYRRGEGVYNDKVEARFVVPVQTRYVRGSGVVAVQWLYADGVDGPPRTVYSGIGDVSYNLPSGAYARGRAAVSSSSSAWAVGPRSVETGTYSLQTDVGRPLGTKGVIDYSLRWNGRVTRWNATSGTSGLLSSFAEENESISHMLTVAGSVFAGVHGSVVGRHSSGTGRRLDGKWTTTKERAWQLSLHRSFGSVEVQLSYEFSTVTAGTRGDAVGAGTRGGVVGAGTRGGVVGARQNEASTLTAIRRWMLGIGWQTERLSVRADFASGLYEVPGLEWRSRQKMHVMPEYELSDHATVWASYEYVFGTAHGGVFRGIGDAAAVVGDYHAHTVRAGVTISF